MGNLEARGASFPGMNPPTGDVSRDLPQESNAARPQLLRSFARVKVGFGSGSSTVPGGEKSPLQAGDSGCARSWAHHSRGAVIRHVSVERYSHSTTPLMDRQSFALPRAGVYGTVRPKRGESEEKGYH